MYVPSELSRFMFSYICHQKYNSSFLLAWQKQITAAVAGIMEAIMAAIMAVMLATIISVRDTSQLELQTPEKERISVVTQCSL